jgi:hypothetical protein
MDMNYDDRKRLTEYLGECWPKWDPKDIDHDNTFPRHGWSYCLLCGISCENHSEGTRTFTTAQDMMDLKDKLSEKHLWYRFVTISKTRFPFNAYDPCYDSVETGLWNWLLNPLRFCQLVADLLNEEE